MSVVSQRRLRGRRLPSYRPRPAPFLFAILGCLVILFTAERWYAQLQYFSVFSLGENEPWRLPSSSALATNTTKDNHLPRATKAQRQRRNHPAGDGTFNHIPIYYRSTAQDNNQRYSSVRCLGESFSDDKSTQSHLSRSCLFQHLCFNTTTKRFILFASPAEEALAPYTATSPRAMISTSMYNKSVALGPLGKIQLQKEGNRYDLFKWFPDIIVQHDNEQQPTGFYELPDNVVWIPFQIIAGQNPGHLLWDSFLTIFRLLTMFDLQPESTSLLLTRLHLPRAVWGTCQMNRAVYEKCQKIVPKFLPIMGVPPETFSTTHDFNLTITANDGLAQSDLVCARTGAAGLGLLADHGWGKHGQEENDWHDYRFAGQSNLLHQFRDYGMQNLGVLSQKGGRLNDNYRIVFSVNSTSSAGRRSDFVPEIAACRAAFGHDANIEIHTVELASMPLVQQVEFISETDILIGAMGGGTATATFLPDGASLILWYILFHDEPQYLDFGIFENAGYIQPHWLPQHWPVEKRTQALVDIILFELERMKRAASLSA